MAKPGAARGYPQISELLGTLETGGFGQSQVPLRVSPPHSAQATPSGGRSTIARRRGPICKDLHETSIDGGVWSTKIEPSRASESVSFGDRPYTLNLGIYFPGPSLSV